MNSFSWTAVQDFITALNPDYIVYAGAAGVLLGFVFLIYFLYRRIRWLLRRESRRKTFLPGVLASLRNAVLILVWVSFFGMILFLGAFLRAYSAFTYEEPVAEILTEALDVPKTTRIWLVQYLPSQRVSTRQFLVRGDQWMIEGDILKWDNWLNFVGLKTRYRLTRLRGRYVDTEMEIRQKPTIYSLVREENHPLWRYLYLYGQELPLVSTVYGNAAFQASTENKRYFLYVATSGFLVREGEG
jgi:amino acid transporter